MGWTSPPRASAALISSAATPHPYIASLSAPKATRSTATPVTACSPPFPAAVAQSCGSRPRRRTKSMLSRKPSCARCATSRFRRTACSPCASAAAPGTSSCLAMPLPGIRRCSRCPATPTNSAANSTPNNAAECWPTRRTFPRSLNCCPNPWPHCWRPRMPATCQRSPCRLPPPRPRCAAVSARTRAACPDACAARWAAGAGRSVSSPTAARRR